MATVLLVPTFEADILHSTAALLYQRGHSATVETDIAEVAKRLSDSPPDVLVCDLSYYSIQQALERSLEGIPTKIVLLVPLKEDGTVMLNWADHAIDDYVLFTPGILFSMFGNSLKAREWMIVITVERQLNRSCVRK